MREAFKLTLNVEGKTFQGELSELVGMVRNAEQNIYEIFIFQIIEQYIAYLKERQKVDLENAGSVILSIANLMYIKSRLLLPYDKDSNLAERKELTEKVVEQILDFERYKMSAEVLENLQDFENHIIERKDKQRVLPFREEQNPEDGWKEVKLYDLISAFARLVFVVDDTEMAVLDRNPFTVEEAMTLISTKLKDTESFDFIELFEEQTTKRELVVFLISILEMVKAHTIILKQQEYFGTIYIFRRS